MNTIDRHRTVWTSRQIIPTCTCAGLARIPLPVREPGLSWANRTWSCVGKER